MRENFFEIWWEQVTGPRRFVDGLKKNISDGLCTVICSEGALPWKNELCDVVIRNDVQTGKWFEIVDGSEFFEHDDVGVFLLERFADEDVRASFAYRRHTASIEKHLKDNRVLQDKVIWVQNLSDSQVDRWLSFFRKYKGNRQDEGVFVLETAIGGLKPPNAVHMLHYSDFVTKYDIHLFASIIASQSPHERYLHQYITYVADNLCGLDAELVVHFIQTTDFTAMNVLDQIKTLTGGMDEHEAEHKLWRAQIQVVFPMIEEERVSFVRKYERAISDCLPVEQFGTPVEDPYDVELGTFKYLLSKKRQEEGHNRLVVSGRDYEQICFLHEIRNKLAHMKCCTVYDIGRLLYS